MVWFCNIEILEHLRPHNRQSGFAVRFCRSRMSSDSFDAANTLLDPRLVVIDALFYIAYVGF